MCKNDPNRCGENSEGVADELYSGPIPANLQVYLDNEGGQNLNKAWHLHLIQPEWEIMELTRQAIQQNRINTSRIKGHQDLKYLKTRWEAHMNHKANQLANRAHIEWS